MHKEGRAVRLLTRSGYDATRRFRELARVLADMPAGSCVIDGEVVACDSYGVPDFLALHFQNARSAVVVVWAFDIIYLDGRDLRDLPLIRRQALLSRLVYRTGNNQLRLSETFDNGAKLLAVAEEFGLEGVVSKRRDAPYRSGDRCGWIKTKTKAWRDANGERWRLEQKR